MPRKASQAKPRAARRTRAVTSHRRPPASARVQDRPTPDEIQGNGHSAAGARRANKARAAHSQRERAAPSRPSPRRRAAQPDEVQAGEAERLEQQEAETQLAGGIPNAPLRKQLMRELDEMIGRVRALHPGYSAPPFSPHGLLQLVEGNLDKMPAGMGLGILGKLRETIGEDLFDADTWKGIWYVLNNTLQYQGDVLKRRVTGEYETDEWGMDREFTDAVRPFFDFMYKTYWRVSLSGIENIPAEGRALLVPNHSGQLPWDAAMLATGILNEHPAQRIVRALYGTWLSTLPFIADLVVKTGQVLATDDNGTRLLEQDQLVAVFPEGYKGAGKLFKDRYHLARFGRGGFVKMALKSRAPLIPVSVVGAEETYISLGKSDLIAKLIGFPYFPVSPTFPWAGLLGFIPLPTKWYIDIGEPISTEKYKPGSEDDIVLVSQLTDQMRNAIQDMIHSRLSQRRSVFFG